MVINPARLVECAAGRLAEVPSGSVRPGLRRTAFTRMIRTRASPAAPDQGHAGGVSAPGTNTYEILVRGEIGEGLAGILGARRLDARPGMTILVIEIIDQSHLRGVLERLSDHDIEIARMNPL